MKILGITGGVGSGKSRVLYDINKICKAYIIEADKLGAEEIGYLIYFFEKACAISGYILGVNPFNQPGVESYKKNMFALLGKPGYESEKEKLEKQLDLW